MIAEDLFERIRPITSSKGTVSACALQCAADLLEDGDELNLMTVGTKLGLSPSESVGVMDGWDKTAGLRAIYAGMRYEGEEWRISPGGYERFTVVPEEYDAGFALGQRLCEDAGLADKAKTTADCW